MIVEFLKNYKHTFKTFKKGDVVRLDPQFSALLLKKKVVKEFDGITKEEIETKKAKAIKNGNNRSN